MTDIFKNDKPVYFDAETKSLYWIEWEETGNNDIPHRHYITPKSDIMSHTKASAPTVRTSTGQSILLKAMDRIWKDLTGRKGSGNELEAYDMDIQDEIKGMIVREIDMALQECLEEKTDV